MKTLKIVLYKNKDDVSSPNFFIATLSEIDSIPDSSFNSLEFGVLDYIPYEKREEMVLKVVRKLRIGGEIFIQCNEYDAIVRSVINNLIEGPKDFSVKLYSGGRLSIDSLRNIMEQVGKCTNVTNVGYSGDMCWLRATRND